MSFDAMSCCCSHLSRLPPSAPCRVDKSSQDIGSYTTIDMFLTLIYICNIDSDDMGRIITTPRQIGRLARRHVIYAREKCYLLAAAFNARHMPVRILTPDEFRQALADIRDDRHTFSASRLGYFASHTRQEAACRDFYSRAGRL